MGSRGMAISASPIRDWRVNGCRNILVNLVGDQVMFVPLVNRQVLFRSYHMAAKDPMVFHRAICMSGLGSTLLCLSPEEHEEIFDASVSVYLD